MSKLTFDLEQAACGNCGLMPSKGVCPIFEEVVEDSEPGCLYLTNSFEFRGAIPVYRMPEGAEKKLHTVRMPKGLYALEYLNNTPIQLALEFPFSMRHEASRLCDFNFALTQEVLSNHGWVDFYRNSDKRTYLDNGACELKEPCTISSIRLAHRLISPTLVLAPDHLRDAGRTFAALQDFLGSFSISQVLPVLQGSSPEGVIDLASEILALGFKSIAVPTCIGMPVRCTQVQMAKARSLIIGVIVEMGFENIHLLGLNSLEEFIIYRGFPEIKKHIVSLDSGMPFSLGMAGTSYPEEPLVKTSPTLSTFRRTPARSWEMDCVVRNVAYLRKLL